MLSSTLQHDYEVCVENFFPREINMDNDIARIAQQIAKGGSNIVFTGAGISTESGIPDFRSKGGLWDKYQPVYFDEFMSSREARIEYWRQKSEMYHQLIQAKPNPAHLAVAELYEMGLLDTVITQNIDGLHQLAGVPEDKVIELHGNTRRVRCMTCSAIITDHEAQQRIEACNLNVSVVAISSPTPSPSVRVCPCRRLSELRCYLRTAISLW